MLYYALPTLRLRNLFLLAASYYFYMNWEPTYALLLLTSTASARHNKRFFTKIPPVSV